MMMDFDEGIRLLESPGYERILELLRRKERLTFLEKDTMMKKELARSDSDKARFDRILHNHIPRVMETCNAEIEAIIMSRLEMEGLGSKAFSKSGPDGYDNDSFIENFWKNWSEGERQLILREAAERERRLLDAVFEFKVRMDWKFLSGNIIANEASMVPPAHII
mmetsp:Transcript_30229/g.64804  ORF Transcript_30229/g.64804 Transcript_30229/m.64804 type:complete len:165 (+) Transcript_30229:157-651(+)